MPTIDRVRGIGLSPAIGRITAAGGMPLCGIATVTVVVVNPQAMEARACVCWDLRWVEY
jgi:hypothetical protein